MARRKKVGDEALVNMLVEDAKLAAAGTPAARENRKKKSRGRMHREMIQEAVCGCGGIAVISKRVPGWNGGWRYKKFCRTCAGIAPQGMLGHAEPVVEEEPAPKLRKCGIKVFA